jgi:1-acyl-sn-glycerol-3-phosphate acyltransferase
MFETPASQPGPYRAPWPRSVPGRTHAVPRLRLLPGGAALDPRLRRRDPAWIRRAYPLLATFTDTYYRAEVEGAEHLIEGPSLIVSTHNGLFFTPDAYTLMVAFWRRFGPDMPGYGLMHRIAFRIPLMGRFLEKMGALPASPEYGQLALRAGYPLVVCPGGDVDALKPWRNRHQITFGERRGFIRMAIAEQVPIVPVVSVGAHEIQYVLTDGQKLAERMAFARRFRIKSVPLALGFPLGLTIAGVGNLPLPSKVRQRFLPPIRLDAPPEAAEDPAVVERCFRQVRDTMQAALDDLAAERRWPVLG